MQAAEAAGAAPSLADATSVVASSLPLLEPLCGIALAFNLAYLNLAIFRYRQQLAKAAKKTLKRLGGNDPDGHLNYSGFPWFWNACILAKDNGFPCEGKFPSKGMKNSSWHKSLNLWFDRKIDVYACVFFCVASGMLLILGVAHSLKWFESTHFLGSGLFLVLGFWLLVIAIIAPTFFVFKGRIVVDHGKDYLSDQVENEANKIEQGLQDSAQGQQAALDAASVQP